MTKAKGSRKWQLIQSDDGYWLWESDDGMESPIFCVRALALAWKRCLAQRKKVKK